MLDRVFGQHQSGCSAVLACGRNALLVGPEDGRLVRDATVVAELDALIGDQIQALRESLELVQGASHPCPKVRRSLFMKNIPVI